MAKIEWKSPIEAMHGKVFAGFGAAKRKSANANGEQYNFSVRYGKRSTTPTSAEQGRWARFKAIALLVATRRTNSTKKIADMAAFKAQSTYKTFTSYLWSICTAEYEAAA